MSTIDYVIKLIDTWLETADLHKHYKIVSRYQLGEGNGVTFICMKDHFPVISLMRLDTEGAFEWRFDKKGEAYKNYIYLADPKFFEKLEQLLQDQCSGIHPARRKKR